MNAPESLVGEVLTYIDVDNESNEILLTTESGRRYKIWHEQDCCESVEIAGCDGAFASLIGRKIVEVTHDEDSTETEDGSQTKTAITFRTDESTVISRWIGYSNGYYSESVTIAEIATRKTE